MSLACIAVVFRTRGAVIVLMHVPLAFAGWQVQHTSVDEMRSRRATSLLELKRFYWSISLMRLFLLKIPGQLVLTRQAGAFLPSLDVSLFCPPCCKAGVGGDSLRSSRMACLQAKLRAPLGWGCFSVTAGN